MSLCYLIYTCENPHLFFLMGCLRMGELSLGQGGPVSALRPPLSLAHPLSSLTWEGTSPVASAPSCAPIFASLSWLWWGDRGSLGTGGGQAEAILGQPRRRFLGYRSSIAASWAAPWLS